MRIGMFRFVTLIVALAASASVRADSNGEQPAVWKSQELNFLYAGFTSRYSCDGLRDKVKDALVALGARADMDVSAYSCTRVDAPEPFPGLTIKIATLTPATQGTAGAVKAQWKTVRLAGVNKLNAGDCELAEQIVHDILPLFTTRKLQARLGCVPHQQLAGNIALTVDVLVPVKN